MPSGRSAAVRLTSSKRPGRYHKAKALRDAWSIILTGAAMSRGMTPAIRQEFDELGSFEGFWIRLTGFLTFARMRR